MDTYPAEAWTRLGRLLAAERGGRSRAAVSAACGVGARTIQEYESGRAFVRPPQKLWDLLRFYRWTPDSLLNVLGGGQPSYLPDAPPIRPLGPDEYAELLDLIDSHPTYSQRRKRSLKKYVVKHEKVLRDAI